MNYVITCNKVQKRPSPEIQSLGEGKSILIVKDSYIARNTLLYPAHSSAASTDFQDEISAEKAIEQSRNNEVALEYFIYPVKIYKLRNKPELAKFTSEFQPWKEETVANWQEGKSNIIVALLRVYKINPILISPIGNMGVVPLPKPVKITNMTPVLSDDDFKNQMSKALEALKTYNLIDQEKDIKKVYKINSEEEQWNVFKEESFVANNLNEMDDLRGFKDKKQFKANYAKKLSSSESNSIWNFYNDMQIGDIIVAAGGSTEILGIGKISSDYIFDSSKSNFKHIRKVKWFILEPLQVTSDLVTSSVLSKNKWESIKQAYASQNTKYINIFSRLENDIGLEVESDSSNNEIFIENNSNVNIETKAIIKPAEMINHIYNYIIAQGFIYSREDLSNFYLSLRAKPFIILAGISGTGKSKLAELFAESVGATSENCQFTLIPVRPDWNDSSDLLGYKDINGNFLPGPLTRVIKKANGELDKPFFVCLDEMNLSRVEYYFSDILSLMETRKKINSGYFSNYIFYPEYFTNEQDRKKFGNLRLPPNLYIIGTVNMDETTFPFSKKVLDRANTIEFSTVNLTAIPADNLDLISPIDAHNEKFNNEYLYIKDCLKHRTYILSVLDKLEEINKILAKANLHVGYRVRDEICFYMLYNNKFGLLNKDDAFDYQLMQKIMPRLQGSDNLINHILIEIFRISTGQDYSKEDSSIGEMALKFVQNNPIIKPYPRTAAKIATMLWRFEDGFTSFWL